MAKSTVNKSGNYTKPTMRKQLFQRIKAGEIKELIIATNATMEGQITAQYIADACNNKNVLVTRLAQGMPIGGELDSLDLNTLSAAFTSRSEMKSS